MTQPSPNRAKQSRARALVILMTVLIAAYMCFAMWRAVLLIRSGSGAAIGLGIAVLMLPLIGAWVVARELFFGYSVQTMAAELEAEGGLAPDDLPRTPSGRVERSAADTAFEVAAADTRTHPDDWRSWFRLGVAYDDARDRKQAREAMRQAARLYRDERIARESRTR